VLLDKLDAQGQSYLAKNTVALSAAHSATHCY